MKHNVIKKTMVSLCAFALCAGLTACSENQEKTAEKFLTSVQTQDFATADRKSTRLNSSHRT